MSDATASIGGQRPPPALTVAAGGARTLARREGAAARGPVLASFKLGTLEFAVDVRGVQEVVRRPSRVMAMPLMPDYAEGIIDLRGTIIPVLRTDVLLGAQAASAPEDAKIAIVVYRGVRLGLLCDDTSRVLRPRAEDIVPLQYAEGSSHGISTSVLKLPDGLLSVIDLERLLGLHGVPQALSDAATAESGGGLARGRRTRRRCISFHVGGSALAFPIEQIHEIVPLDTLERSPVPDPATVGLMRIRGSVVPVVRFAQVLGVDGHGEALAAHTESSRVVILRSPSACIGLLVDSVDAIEAYAEEQCLRMPALRQEHAGLYAGCIDFGELGHRLLLDAMALLQFEPIARVAGQHRALYEDDPARRSVVKSAGQRQTYLWFQCGQGFAMPLREIREIVPQQAGLTPMPGAPDHVVGLVNLRGSLVPVFDLQRFYRLPAQATAGDEVAGDGPKVLVLQHDGELLGLRVESIRSMLHIGADDRFAVPALMRATLPPALRDDIREVVHAVASEDEAVDLLVVNVARMVSSSLAPGAAPQSVQAAA